MKDLHLRRNHPSESVEIYFHAIEILLSDPRIRIISYHPIHFLRSSGFECDEHIMMCLPTRRSDDGGVGQSPL